MAVNACDSARIALGRCVILTPMTRWFVALLATLSLAASAPAEEVPPPDLPQASDEPDPVGGQPLEIEPPLLITTRGPDGMPIVAGRDGAPANADIAKIEKDLARAKRNAGGAERLFKGGIISRVEMEERQLRVVRLQASLEAARLAEVTEALEQRKAEASDPEELAATERSLAELADAAARAAEEKNRDELEAALRNLERQQKLLALGSGRKADLNRAQQRLAELQRTKD